MRPASCLRVALLRCEGYFAGSGRMIDQAYRERLPDGMVRCYLAGNEVVGFGHQRINALFPAPSAGAPGDAPQPGPRLYYSPTTPEFQAIKTNMEAVWLDALCSTLDLEPRALPVIWDADLLFGLKTAAREDTYVLCEINVSAVSPFPEEALAPMARLTQGKAVVSPTKRVTREFFPSRPVEVLDGGTILARCERP